MSYIICGIAGYLIGCINAAYLVGKSKGFDIRNKGSNNPGASNAAITMGFKIGVLVAVWDILKAAIAVFAAKILFPDDALIGTVAGVGCILGHMFPVFMSFNGGKGFASFMGMMLMSNWKAFLIIGIIAVIITVITDYIAIATLTTVITYPLYIIFSTGEYLIPLVIAIASLAMIYKHLINIKRILEGNEIGLSSLWKK
ncbi:MAG: glycerol-3-phosphate 1-O-acyltransferase PlsY [Clostridiaceae bacterium]